jgi:hypothetical protein
MELALAPTATMADAEHCWGELGDSLADINACGQQQQQADCEMLGQEASCADQDMADDLEATDALAGGMSWVAAGDPLDDLEDSLAEGWAAAQAERALINLQQQQSMAVDGDLGSDLAGALQPKVPSHSLATNGLAWAGAGHFWLGMQQQQQQWVWGKGATRKKAAAAAAAGVSGAGSPAARCRKAHRKSPAAVRRSLAWLLQW